jgi:hypothetical protein
VLRYHADPTIDLRQHRAGVKCPGYGQYAGNTDGLDRRHHAAEDTDVDPEAVRFHTSDSSQIEGRQVSKAVLSQLDTFLISN